MNVEMILSIQVNDVTPPPQLRYEVTAEALIPSTVATFWPSSKLDKSTSYVSVTT